MYTHDMVTHTCALQVVPHGLAAGAVAHPATAAQRGPAACPCRVAAQRRTGARRPGAAAAQQGATEAAGTTAAAAAL